MNVTKAPFNNPKVRQAVACAVPTRRSWMPCCSGWPSDVRAAGKPAEAVWPQAHTYNTYAKAKALLAEAGYPEGFETTLSFDLGFAGVNEPLCVLVQESLGQIGSRPPSIKFPAPTGAPN